MGKPKTYTFDKLTNSIVFGVSGRSTGGWKHEGHILDAITAYKAHMPSVHNYASIIIRFEDGIANRQTARTSIKSYRIACDRIKTLIRQAGGTFDIDVQFTLA